MVYLTLYQNNCETKGLWKKKTFLHEVPFWTKCNKIAICIFHFAILKECKKIGTVSENCSKVLWAMEENLSGRWKKRQKITH